MTNEERDIQRKLKVLQHAEKIGNARKGPGADLAPPTSNGSLARVV